MSRIMELTNQIGNLYKTREDLRNQHNKIIGFKETSLKIMNHTSIKIHDEYLRDAMKKQINDIDDELIKLRDELYHELGGNKNEM